MIAKWVLELWDVDFQKQTTKTILNKFISKIARKNEPEFRFIQRAIKQLVSTLEAHILLENQNAPSLEDIGMQNPNIKHEILNFESEEIAQALCHLDFNRLNSIKPVEFLLHLWGEKGIIIQNLDGMINAFNKIGYWVPTTVCTQPDLKTRVKIIEKFIKVAKHCLTMKNYNMSMAIYSGLNGSAVSRLKQTWAQIEPKRLKILQELEIAFSPTQNYKNYRANLESTEMEPCIPVVSIFLKDLTFMNDGNQKFVEPGMINFGKAKTMYIAVLDFLKYRNVRDKGGGYYSPPAGNKEVMEFVQNLRSLRDKDNVLHKYSLICEPRASETPSLSSKWAADSKNK